jgi:hypothetical protein
MRHIRNGLLIAALAALAACSGGAAPAADEDPTEAPAATGAEGNDEGNANEGASGDFDLCATLTTDEISAATRVDGIETLGANLGTGQYSCNYNSTDGLAVAGHTFTTTDSGISPQQMFDANAADGEDVSGVGDAATMVGDDDFPMLWVSVEDDLYAITVIADSLSPDEKRAAAIELAKIAIGRLP